MTTALLILNPHEQLFSSAGVHDANRILATLQDLIVRAGSAGAPVILVRDASAHNSIGDIHPAVAPNQAAALIDSDTPNAFLRTGLAPWLVQNGISRLVVAGLVTELAVDTTVHAAYSLGYPVTLVADAHTTVDSATLTADQIIAHHNAILAHFAAVVTANETDFSATPLELSIENLTPGDLAAIQAGLAEWRIYERWLSQGDGAPYWPHTHPAMVADRLHQLWDPAFRLRPRYTDPPPWEMGIARTFIQPLMDTPMFVRKTAVQAVTKAFDHLLQNPRNPLSPHINKLADHLYSYDARDIRLIYVPQVVTGPDGRERRVIFLLWAAPGVPERNPFAF